MSDYPAPWYTKGSAFIVPIFKADVLYAKDFEFAGGLGALYIVNYAETPVGPYQEIVYVPGNVWYQNKKYKSVHKIYVTSRATQEAGIKNWALPKEMAQIQWLENKTKTTIEMQVNEKKVAHIEAKIHLPSLTLPFNTRFVPFLLTDLLQKTQAGQVLLNPAEISGRIRLATLSFSEVDPEWLPLLGKNKIGFYLDPFCLTLLPAVPLE